MVRRPLELAHDTPRHRLAAHIHEVHHLILHCRPSAHHLVHVLPCLPATLQRLELTVPTAIPATDVAHALSHCTALVSLSLTLPSIANPTDLDPLASPHLQSCTLRVTQQCTLPSFFPFVQHCAALLSLDVAVDNATVCTAPSFGSLSRLQTLSLRGVNLDAVPDTLNHLTALSDLDISFNSPPLTVFPRTLAALTSLSRVVLHNALSHHVPAALSTLPALHHLDVAYNCDAAVTTSPTPSPAVTSDSPRTMQRTHLCLPTSMRTLRTLCLSSNALLPGQLHSWLPALKRLTRLDLSGCRLEAALPSTLTALTALQHLDLSGNNLPALPVDIVLGLPKLCTLHCMGNATMHLPPSALTLAAHPSLTLVDLRRQEGPGPTHWDAPSLLVLVHLTWLMLAGHRCSVWVGCEHGVVVEGVFRGEFGGGGGWNARWRRTCSAPTPTAALKSMPCVAV